MKPEKISMIDFAHHIIAVANKKGLVVTDLQLQKVMYFAFKYMIRNNLLPESLEKSYSDNPFLVWRYGPVVEKVYDEFCFYGANPILDNFELISTFNENVNDEICNLLNDRIFNLVNKSHQEQFWKNHVNDIVYGRSNVSYGLEDIEN